MEKIFLWKYCFLVLTILILILQGIADGLFYRGKKTESKIVECSYIFLFLCFTQINVNLGFVVAFYVLMRLAVYDIFCNLFMGFKVNHAGTTSWLYDKMISKFKNWQWWLFRVMFLGLAILIYIL